MSLEHSSESSLLIGRGLSEMPLNANSVSAQRVFVDLGLQCPRCINCSVCGDNEKSGIRRSKRRTTYRSTAPRRLCRVPPSAAVIAVSGVITYIT